jgi:hypothetical protein
MTLAPAPRRGQVRVVLDLEEAPCFAFLRAGERRPRRYRFVQGERVWEIENMAGELAQRLMLAFFVIADEQRGQQTIHYSLPLVCEILRVERSNKTLDRIRVAVRELAGLNIYVRGAPLAGPSVDPLKAARGDRATYLYRFIGDTLVQMDERVGDAQLYLFPRRGQHTRLQSSIRLSQYVAEALAQRRGRVVPDWIFELRHGYAVRLARLLGKRANGEPQLTIGRERLASAIPALGRDGQLMPWWRLQTPLERAHQALRGVGFISDVLERDDGALVYRFGAAADARRERLSERDRDVVDDLVRATRSEQNRPFYVVCVRELGADRARAALSDCLTSGTHGLAPRLGRVLQSMREENQAALEEARAHLGRGQGTPG